MSDLVWFQASSFCSRPLLSPCMVVSIPLPGRTQELIPQVLCLGCRTHWALLTWTRCAPGAALPFWSRGSQQPPPLHSSPPASAHLLPVGLFPTVGTPCCIPAAYHPTGHCVPGATPAWPRHQRGVSCSWEKPFIHSFIHSFLLAQHPQPSAGLGSSANLSAMGGAVRSIFQ